MTSLGEQALVNKPSKTSLAGVEKAPFEQAASNEAIVTPSIPQQ
jgi:hypothetical protein